MRKILDEVITLLQYKSDIIHRLQLDASIIVQTQFSLRFRFELLERRLWFELLLVLLLLLLLRFLLLRLLLLRLLLLRLPPLFP